MALEPLDKALEIAEGMEKRRGLDVMVLDVRDLMSITDYFVICHGRSQTHVDAVAESIEEHVEQQGIHPEHREGKRGASWVIIDYGSVVAHVFTEESRDFYDLERLWEDAVVVEHQTEDAPTAEANEPTGSDGTP